MSQQQQWLSKYNVNGPRYTSYPTALEFNQTISLSQFVEAAVRSTNKAVSLYFHIPFCHQLCYYCGCNKIVTRHQDKSEKYLEKMLAELSKRAEWLKHKPVNQIHFGGGTPNFLTGDQFKTIFARIHTLFKLTHDAEVSVELDVRHVDAALLKDLKACGVNRLSFGIQDTNREVQVAINRIQPNSMVLDVLTQARQIGFDSINLDVICGLPHQTEASFTQTLDDIIEFQPERISLFNYAHLPQRFASQRKIKDEWLPTPQQRLQLMLLANEKLCEQAEYVAVGFDHFAKSTDSLVTAQQVGQLHRNFQGYTTLDQSDLLAVGVSAISQIGDLYVQNPKSLADYYAEQDKIGRQLTLDDRIRAELIQALMCNFQLPIAEFERRWEIDFKAYFAAELNSLKTFENDEMLSVSEDLIKIAPAARMFVRNICMTFDQYMAKQLNQRRFSQVI